MIHPIKAIQHSKKILNFGLYALIGIMLFIGSHTYYAQATEGYTTVAGENPTIATKPIVTKYGHFPYHEAPGQSLVAVGNGQRLHKEAAAAMKAMAQTAKKSGAQLYPLSGYRSVALQSELFEAQIQRRGSVQVAARISAPPGYSEHHTGYAMDFGDYKHPSTDLEESFANTPAFQWLTQHAHEYGFEMSFPQDNPQGIIYEPWHWRYVGSQGAQQVFAQTRQNLISVN